MRCAPDEPVGPAKVSGRAAAISEVTGRSAAHSAVVVVRGRTSVISSPSLHSESGECRARVSVTAVAGQRAAGEPVSGVCRLVSVSPSVVIVRSGQDLSWDI